MGNAECSFLGFIKAGYRAWARAWVAASEYMKGEHVIKVITNTLRVAYQGIQAHFTRTHKQASLLTVDDGSLVS